MKAKKLKVGDRVAFKMGKRTVHATIIEDRGAIGVGGRQLLRIRVDADNTAEPSVFEIPAEDVAAA
jgi:hypothetical protein